jgi:hypothetical protein
MVIQIPDFPAEGLRGLPENVRSDSSPGYVFYSGSMLALPTAPMNVTTGIRFATGKPSESVSVAARPTTEGQPNS